MKVRIDVTLPIDVEAWCDNYGTDPSEVRADAKEHAKQSLVEHFRNLDLLEETP